MLIVPSCKTIAGWKGWKVEWLVNVRKKNIAKLFTKLSREEILEFYGRGQNRIYMNWQEARAKCKMLLILKYSKDTIEICKHIWSVVSFFKQCKNVFWRHEMLLKTCEQWLRSSYEITKPGDASDKNIDLFQDNMKGLDHMNTLDWSTYRQNHFKNEQRILFECTNEEQEGSFKDVFSQKNCPELFTYQNDIKHSNWLGREISRAQESCWKISCVSSTAGI